MHREKQRRSDCPVNFMVESFGDKWSLLIVRDIVFYGKQTYNDFLRSEEKIATNILANRLQKLEENNIIIKLPHPTDKRKDVYRLTNQGLDLVPLLFEIVLWSAEHDPQTDAPADTVDFIRYNKSEALRLVRQNIRQGQASFLSRFS